MLHTVFYQKLAREQWTRTYATNLKSLTLKKVRYYFFKERRNFYETSLL